jgi:hypothetical protein
LINLFSTLIIIFIVIKKKINTHPGKPHYSSSVINTTFHRSLSV